MKIVIESENNHKIDDYGKNELTFEVKEDIVFIRAKIQGIEHDFDFDLDVEQFENLINSIKIQCKQMDFKP
jgi:hypothetical protein